MEPWESLDVDDSDLSAFLRPCKRQNHQKAPSKTTDASSADATATSTTTNSQPIVEFNSQLLTETLNNSQSRSLLPQSDSSNHSLRLIPGPAGAVQAAMQRRAQSDGRLSENTDEPIPTQEFIGRVVENDLDFNTNPWISAIDFIRREVDSDSMALATPLRSIKKILNLDRLDQVIAIIKSCTLNGLGDVMVTLKDPTGTVGATLHRKVFTEKALGKDISVGAVLILQKVVAFSPARSACYLNITLRNIVKVFPKECGPPSKQDFLVSSAGWAAVGAERRNERSCMVEEIFSVPRERTESVVNNFRMDTQLKENTQNNKQMEIDKFPDSGFTDNGLAGDKHKFIYTEDLSARKGISKRLTRLLKGSNYEVEKEMSIQTTPFDKSARENREASTETQSASPNLVPIAENQETGMKNESEKMPVTAPKSALPHWTEEQLEELFALD